MRMPGQVGRVPSVSQRRWEKISFNNEGGGSSGFGLLGDSSAWCRSFMVEGLARLHLAHLIEWGRHSVMAVDTTIAASTR